MSNSIVLCARFDDEFSERLNASIGSTTGVVTGTGSLNLLGPGQTDQTKLMLGINTSNVGSVSGTAIIDFQSDGTGTSELAVTALASQTVNVTANVYRLGQANDLTATALNFNVHEGQAGSQALSITNQAATDGFSESLNVRGVQRTAPVVVRGAIYPLGPGKSDSASVMVEVLSPTAGPIVGTATIELESDGTGTSELGTTGLAAQIVNVSGGIFRLAVPSALTSQPFPLNVRVGDSTEQALAITNEAATDGFSESLNGRVSRAGNLNATGSFSLRAPGATDNKSLMVSVDTTNVGPFSGNVTIDFESDGMGRNGLGITALPPQKIDIDGCVYRLAEASLLSAIDFGIVYVGEDVQVTIPITDIAPADGFSESLNARFESITGDAIGAGAVALLGAGASDNSLSVMLDASTAGAKAGRAVVLYESDGTGTSVLPVTALATQSIEILAQVNHFANPSLSLANDVGTLTRTGEDFLLDLGRLLLEEPSPVAELVLTNQASLPADDLTGNWFIDTDDFNLTGFAPFSDLAAGNAITGPLVSLADISPGNFFADLTLTALSVNARGSTPLSDISLDIRVSRIPEPSSLVWMVFAALWLFGPAARVSRP